jgi:hypothetical protein
MAKRKSRPETPEERASWEWWDRRGRERIAERLEIEGEFEQAARERAIIRQRYGPPPAGAAGQAEA